MSKNTKKTFSEKKGKMTKPLLSKGFDVFLGSFLGVCFCHLLSDTEDTS